MCRSCRKTVQRRRKVLRVLKTGIVTADFVADRLGVSARTIYRDIAALREKGMPILGEAGVGFMLRRREARHA